VSEPDRPARRRRRSRDDRSATDSLLSIVLVLEVFLAFFATLVVFALGTLQPAPAFIGGGVLVVLLLAASRVQQFPWGNAIGWLLQAALIATGVLVPLMFIIGVGFAVLWAYCFFTGRRLDRQNASRADPDATGPTPAA